MKKKVSAQRTEPGVTVALTETERFTLSEAGRARRVTLGCLIKDSMRWFIGLSDAEARKLLRKHPSYKLTQIGRLILRAFLVQNQCMLRRDPPFHTTDRAEVLKAYHLQLKIEGNLGDEGKRNNEDAIRITLTRQEEAQLKELASLLGFQKSVLARLAIMRFAKEFPWTNEQMTAGNYYPKGAPDADSHA